MTTFPRAILIDLDDTLLDDSSNVDACWIDACAVATDRVHVSVVELRQTIGGHVSVYRSNPENDRNNYRAATRQLVEQAFKTLGIADLDLAYEIAERYQDLRGERSTPFPGVKDALDHLRRKGVRLGMMTNGNGAGQRARINRFGLGRYFDHIVIEGELGAGKPDPRVYDTLLSALDSAPEDTWAIGDNLELDVLAPMRLGLHGIWVDLRNAGLAGHPDRPHRVVSAFTEIVETPA